MAIDFLMGGEIEGFGRMIKHLCVAEDYVTRTGIHPYQDAMRLDDFTAWRVASAGTAMISASIVYFVLALQAPPVGTL